MTTLAWAACWLSLLLLLHIFIGYPLLVWLLARLHPVPVAKQPVTPTVSVVIAVHDGNRYIRTKLRNLKALDYPAHLVEIIVACDGCTDVTPALVRHCRDPRVKLLNFAERRGKAACLNDAVAAATGDVLLLTDVRQKLSPTALRELVANLADAHVGAVGGELHLENVRTGFAKGVDAYWRYEKLIRQSESLSGSTIGVSGAIYAMRRDLWEGLPPGTVLDDVLVPMQVAAHGYRVVFEPKALAWDQPSQEPLAESRRKVRTLAGNYQLVQLAPWLLSPWRNPLWFRFLSHKLLRLAAPWLVLVLTLATAALSHRSPLYAVMFAGLVAAGLTVALGKLLPPFGRWLPVRLALAFYYLNLFAAQALFAFARKRGLHLW